MAVLRPFWTPFWRPPEGVSRAPKRVGNGVLSQIGVGWPEIAGNRGNGRKRQKTAENCKNSTFRAIGDLKCAFSKATVR